MREGAVRPTRRILTTSLVIALAGAACSNGARPAPERRPAAPLASVEANVFRSLEWRPIGPPRAGRAPAVAGDPRDPLVFYFGAASGGVWKTVDGGLYWRNVSDGYFTSASVNALAVADSDPRIVYAGTGEVCTHPNIEPGDGVYKSTDGGTTWQHLGLVETRHIGRIVVDPKNPDLVYVAAMGHHFGANPERGVFRSKDGGRSWQKVLFKSDRAGAVDLAMDPSNPNILYAAIWQFLRQPWSESSGGPDSGLWKSTDGGDTWKDISHNPGLPTGVMGKIGLSISASRPKRIYAIVEAADGGLFRSDDAGATWQLMSNRRDFRWLASSYTHVTADPTEPDTVYLSWMQLLKSTDGGRTLASVPMAHSDHHALWIDPRNPNRMIDGSDGGAVVSLDGGGSWSSPLNQPTAQFFHIAVDNQTPYRVYATQMDSSAVSCPSTANGGVIAWNDCDVVGTAESGSIVVRPDDPDIIVAGSIGSSAGGGGNMVRFDRRSRQQRLITVWPEDQYGSPVKDVKYRFYFTYPIVMSPHDPNTIYAAANRVFKTTDLGGSWQPISPDLTKQDASKMQEIDGGPITSQQFSSQYSSVIYAFAESRLTRGELWAGTDSSNIWLSRDGGASWTDVSPAGLLPDWTIISTIEPSPHDAGTAYVAAHRYKLDDTRPYLLKTTDYGRTWRPITAGIRAGDFCRVIREDPVRPGLLFVGTWSGVYVSFDAGDDWQSLQLNLPVVPVHDLVVKGDDLVAGTFGRAIWILDDVTPLREVSRDTFQGGSHLFTVPTAYRLVGGRGGLRGGSGVAGDVVRPAGENVGIAQVRGADGRVRPTVLNGGESRPGGVWVSYYLPSKPAGDVTLTFLDGGNHAIRTYSSAAAGGRAARVPAEAGTNRFLWDMTYPPAREIAPGPFTNLEWARAAPPVAPPGSYKVRLEAGGRVVEQPFEIRRDPRVRASDADLQAQFDLMMKIRDRLSEVTDAVNRIRESRSRLDAAEQKMAGRTDVRAAAEEAKRQLQSVEGVLTRLIGPNPMFVPPKTLNIRLAALTSVVQSSDDRPPRQAYDVFENLSQQVASELARLKQIEDKEVAGVFRLVAG
jgi:photosystem II stability/assembly factor-like uncharacterized protein